MVEDFITPYKTVITEKDFEYSQGDYNVQAVIALGVEQLDYYRSPFVNLLDYFRV